MASSICMNVDAFLNIMSKVSESAVSGAAWLKDVQQAKAPKHPKHPFGMSKLSGVSLHCYSCHDLHSPQLYSRHSCLQLLVHTVSWQSYQAEAQIRWAQALNAYKQVTQQCSRDCILHTIKHYISVAVSCVGQWVQDLGFRVYSM